MKETKFRIIFSQKNLKGHIDVEKSIHILHYILFENIDYTENSKGRSKL